MSKPLIIGIGGTHSRAGKTTLATAILEYFTKDTKDSYKLKNKNKENSSSFVTHKRWGAIKYTKTAFPPCIVSDKKVLIEKDKDTYNMMRAGALEVLWVKSPNSRLGDVLPGAVKRLSHLDGIIVEGNSAIEFLKPAIVIFIIGGDKQRWKAGIESLITIADIILYDNKVELPKISKTTKIFYKNLLDKEEYRRFFELISSLLDEKRTKNRAESEGS